MTEKKTGRPPKYTEAQVLEGINIVERNGDTPTGETVKKAMCVHLDVPPGINAQSLEKEVQRLLNEREHQQSARLIAALPETSRNAVREICQAVEAAILLHLGREHDELRRVNEQKVTQKDMDLANQRAQIRDLLMKLDQQAEEVAALEEAARAMQDQLHETEERNSVLLTRVTELEKRQDFREEMFAF
ncbi:hypothetical protein CBW24_08640 [Pacificitalea manganoxidans]|uniref:KfrA N-terminal DNA-binding domain-containing protein n=1 Tax=Pacificitalea manganoxidans TaxID=1411902 RepID=A0A291LZW9_9RHOB|nr:hypothetical protein [Pacificitalea manganoxidans]ATI42068.1 hypothetical protein CBW24_08640 [Pacificitalea manganoxidans]MDR6308135.1 vacuolar-type H+-ATPase subunit I/STV1 [Pacificitalea manganoxidans]